MRDGWLEKARNMVLSGADSDSALFALMMGLVDDVERLEDEVERLRAQGRQPDSPFADYFHNPGDKA